MDEVLKKFAEGKVPCRHVADDEIDYSDIPEITGEEWKNFRPLYVNGKMDFSHPGKAAPVKAAAGRTTPSDAVPVHLDAGLVANLTREAKKRHTTCESLISRILENHLAHAR